MAVTVVEVRKVSGEWVVLSDIFINDLIVRDCVHRWATFSYVGSLS